MDMRFVTLRKQLDELGYRECLSLDCLPLVERITGDLLQTTRSLQHYMDLSKEVIQERDNLKSVADPYICDNTKLVRENNKLHQELISVREELEAALRKAKTRIRKLENSVSSLEFQNRNLKMRCRDHELRNICADTFSSRSKQVTTGYVRPCCAKQTKDSPAPQPCICDKQQCCVCMELQEQLEEVNKKLNDYDMKNGGLEDEIAILQGQLSNRDKEMQRLSLMLEGGRPYSALQRDCCGKDLDRKLTGMRDELEEYDQKILSLSAQLKDALDKQHEAAERASKLADKNTLLVKELQNIDQLALRIETESNENLKERSHVILKLENQLETVERKFKNMEKELESVNDKNRSLRSDCQSLKTENHALSLALDSQTEVKEKLLKENEMLLRINKNMESSKRSDDYLSSSRFSHGDGKDKTTKEELLQLLEKERQIYEMQINDVKKQLADVNRNQIKFSKASVECSSCDKLRFERDILLQKKSFTSDDFVGDLKNRICELEQHVQCLKKQNEILTENNNSLKVCLEQNTSGRQRKHSHSSELDNYMHLTVTRLEKELNRANSNIQCLEEDNNVLKSKLRMFNYRDFHSPSIVKESHYVFNERHPSTSILKQENEILMEKIKSLETELLHVKSVNSQLKTLQMENDKNISASQAKFYEAQRDMQSLKDHMKLLEKEKFDLERECHLHKSEKMSLRDNISKIDQERDRIINEIDDKTEKIASIEHEMRSKSTNIEMLENRVKELNRKLDMVNTSNSSLEHRWRDSQTRNEALSTELDSIVKQRDSALIENKRLQSDLAAVSNDLRVVNVEYERSRKEVEQMKQQLQHYVDDVRRIEDILSKKEAERTEIFNQFANLSHEATVLETNNHSLENESASKSIQLQVSGERISELEKKLESRESLIDMQEEKIAKLIFNVSKLESELTQQKELARMAEKNLEFARETCVTLEKQKKSMLMGIGDTDTEKRKLEYNLKMLKDERSKLEDSCVKDRATVESLESLLNSSRREVVELKLKLQEAVQETEQLREKVKQLQDRIQRLEGESHSTRQRSDEAAKNLHELQWQINEERFKRSHVAEPHLDKIFGHHTSTL